ncbi:CLUMA_CG008290, isoform A [Clunio marinus]|uniref:CLUMA_CG008290, isoform A n=1 Tax=Clunio marinus TaxID=568069 RepID=A0A1J1I5D1_9DIPT|nr:CLUMA_CG008290, isoform A [Clunio marinus]
MKELFRKNLTRDETSPLITKETNDDYNKQSNNPGFYGSSSSSDKESSDCEKGSTDLSPSSFSSHYPIAVIFVLVSKCFEAFAANGVRSILALYLRDSLKFNEDFSTAVLHSFNFFSQFLPIVGAILADSYLGNKTTIFYFCIPYALGYLGTLIGTLPIQYATHSLIYASLFLIAIGNGCLRACITALGGHQFKIPQQKHSLDRYFALYYFCYYVGILLGKIIPAYVRTDVYIPNYCEIGEGCYTAVFAVIAVVFLLSWMVFLSGLPFYAREHVTGDNTMLRVFNCICYASYRKIFRKSKETSWIRASIGKYSEEFVNDVSIFLKVVTLFTPIPIYYALLAQQDSSWTFQATQTNLTITDFQIQADQFKAVGPILLLIQIPVWQKIVLPFMERKGFHLSSLESVSIGGLCAAFSFVWAGFLQHRIAMDPEDLPSILWQFPMFFLLMMGEVLISVPGLKFCYTHAPTSMKSVLTAVWFINNAMGNLLVVIITELQLIENKSLEYFFYAFLMFIATILFTIMSGNYERECMTNENISDEKTIESFIYVDAIQSTNLEENYLNDSNDDDTNSDYESGNSYF